MTDAERDALLTAFYRERLLPIAETSRVRGHAWLDAKLDAAAESYYIPCEPRATHVFALPADEMASALAALWSRKDVPELAELAASIIALAATLHVPDDEPGEVSPFIYAMF